MASGRWVWVRWAAVCAACGVLATAGAMGWAATEKSETSKPTTLTDAEAEHIRRTLEQLTANHEKILAALEEIEAQLSIVKVRVTR